jgi:tRNA dimethylallyltransferase
MIVPVNRLLRLAPHQPPQRNSQEFRSQTEFLRIPLRAFAIMLPPPFQNATVLTGPTGSGKTRLGIEVARQTDAEIVSMDSMALYRGMDIGTAKPTRQERGDVPHHLIDVLDPWESANVAWWLGEARRVCTEIEARCKRALFVGGTPLYLKALMFGLFEGPPADDELRRRLTAEADCLGVAALHERLRHLDPASAQRIHGNDLRRIIRALEVFELTGKPLSAWQTQWREVSSPWSVVSSESTGGSSLLRTTDYGLLTGKVLWLDVPRPELYARINRRVDEMFAAGLVEEMRGLWSLGRPLSREASQALGYKEVLAHLDGERDLATTIDLVKTRSRNFAKRQTTWFRHLPGLTPFCP